MRNFCKRTNVNDISVTKFEYILPKLLNQVTLLFGCRIKSKKVTFQMQIFQEFDRFDFALSWRKVPVPILNSLQNREFP